MWISKKKMGKMEEAHENLCREYYSSNAKVFSTLWNLSILLEDDKIYNYSKEDFKSRVIGITSYLRENYKETVHDYDYLD